jgi:hypothetical protein
MIHGHLSPGMACLDGKLYVAGGVDENWSVSPASEVYDIGAGYWDDDAMKDLPVKWWGSGDFLMGSVLFLAGGRAYGEERAATLLHDLYYNANTDYWTVGPLLQEARYRLEADSAQGVGYALGGWGTVWSPHDSTEVLLPCQEPAHLLIYVSSTSDGNAGGVAFRDEDILAFDTVEDTWSMYFDGSDVGLDSSRKQDIDAFYLMADGSLLLSIAGDSIVPDVGSVDDSDIVRFIPTSLGSDTAGSFELYFDGSDVELSGSREDLDAIYVLADGRLVLSTVDSFGVSGASGKDEDLIIFTPTSLGANTSGSWDMHFDGSDVGLSNKTEDINGVWVEEGTGDIYLSTLWTFNVDGSSGDGSDLFICHPGSLGSDTSCTFGPGLYWDGSANGFAGEVVDGLAIGLSD